METKIPYTPDQSQLAVIQRKLYLDNRVRGGAAFFFLISFFSILNTILFLFGSKIFFVFGLGATQIVDGLTYRLAKDLGQGGIIIRILGLVIDVCIAGVFVVLGVFVRKRIRWPSIIGMVLYIIDGIIFLLFRDFLGAVCHLLFLFFIWRGLQALLELEVLEKSGTSESIESIRQRMPSLRPSLPQITRQQIITRLISRLILIVCIIIITGFLVFVWLFVFASLQH